MSQNIELEISLSLSLSVTQNWRFSQTLRSNFSPNSIQYRRYHLYVYTIVTKLWFLSATLHCQSVKKYLFSFDSQGYPFEKERKSKNWRKIMSHARALYDYDAQDSDELSFKEGDVIEVTTRAEDWSDGYDVVFKHTHSLSLSLHLPPTPTHTHQHQPTAS